jgi:hypothetical protein
MNGTSGQGYEYEIFISYPRRIPVRGFVIGGFGPVLEEQLALRLPQPPKVFIDQKNLETGVRWPDALADIHAKSKVLIPVLIPAYFNSDWCVAEYESMLCREAHICREARVKGQNPNLCRLIFPVLLATASQFPFPAHVRKRLWVDLTAFNAVPTGALRRNARFVKAVGALAESLMTTMYPGPQFKPNWPRLCRKAPRPTYAFSPMQFRP